MSTIAENLTRIQQAKADIKTAIEAKGVSVPSSATIDTYDDYVSQISGGGGTTYENEVKGIIDRSIQSIDIPSGITSIGNNVFRDCLSLSSVTMSDSVTSIGQSAFQNCSSLTSINIHSGVTSIGSYAFSNVSGSGAKSINLSLFDLSGIYPSSTFNNVFSDSYIDGSITIPNNLLSGATRGTSSNCYNLFNGAFCPLNNSLTINIYADNSIIPRSMCYFSNASTINTGNITIIVHGTPTFLSRQSFRLISGVGVGNQIVKFVDCETPPDAPAYTGASSPFYQFTGIIYVPSSGLNAWKTKYTGVADNIQAIPT